MVEVRGIEPLTSTLRTSRSSRLSYTPTRLRISDCGLQNAEPVSLAVLNRAAERVV